jgi:hypothetical protein
MCTTNLQGRREELLPPGRTGCRQCAIEKVTDDDELLTDTALVLPYLAFAAVCAAVAWAATRIPGGTS